MKMEINGDDLSLPFILTLPSDDTVSNKNRKGYSLLDWKLIKKILSLSGQRIFSLDGSMEFWVISYLIGQFKDDQGDSTDYQAAASLISTITNFKICFILFPLMSFFTIGGPLLGKMNPSDSEIKTNILIGDNPIAPPTEALEAKSQYNRLARNTLLVGAPFAFAATSTVLYSNQIWKLLGRSDRVIDLTQQFLQPLSLLTPVIVVRFVSEAILFMGDKSSTVMSVSMACWLLFGVFSSYFLGMGGIGKFTFPAMKIPGVFWGFCGQILISCLVLMAVVKKSANFRDFDFLKDFFKWTAIDAKQVREIIPVSLANWLAIVAELGAQLALNVMAANLGVTQLAAEDFVAEINFFFLLVTYSLGQVGQQLVGIALGAENKTEASRIAKYTLGLCLLPAPIYALFALKPRFITDLTLDVDADVLQYTDTLIPYACMTSMLYTLQYVMLETLRPTKKFYRALSLAIGGLWGGVLAAHFLSKKQDVIGIAKGSLLGGVLAAAGVSYDFSKNFLMSPQTQSYPSAEFKAELEFKQPELSSNRYGCFNRLRKLYKRVFQTQQETTLTESRYAVQ